MLNTLLILILLTVFLKYYILQYDSFTIIKSFISAPTGDFKCKNRNYYNNKVVYKNSCSRYDNSPELCDDDNCNSIRPKHWNIPCYPRAYIPIRTKR